MNGMKTIGILHRPATSLAAALLLALTAGATAAQTTSYEVDVNDRHDDLFKVTVTLDALDAADSIFQFAATAPGTYQVMDIGRYVRELTATDAQGQTVPVTRVGTNRWRLGDPARTRTVRYRIAETWDTPVAEHVPYLMCGTSIEADNVLISPHAVFGFPARRQADPVRLKIDRPADWTVGSALVPDANGWYHAEDYDQLIDSPILMGSTLTSASMDVGDVPVEVWVYSKTGKIQADQLLGAMRTMLTSAGQFLDGLPVDRYAFLWHFEDTSMGAWEHSYSSEYVMAEPPAWTPAVAQSLTDIAAHEFFHVMTPLNIHSEIIEHFNFETPTPSQHLWLYEGTTEWASEIMQLRSGILDVPEYLGRQAGKIKVDRQYFDADYSLKDLALKSYTDLGQRQYGNIYMRGAVVAGLLDIRLLELSGGKRGLRELILDLSQEYGKDRPFPEDRFFDIVAEKTYPEIADFFNRYVKAAQPLPIAEYYAKLGIRFVDGDSPRFEILPNPTPDQLRLRNAWMKGRPAA